VQPIASQDHRNPVWIDVESARLLVDVSRRTVYAWMELGVIRWRQNGLSRLVDKSSLFEEIPASIGDPKYFYVKVTNYAKHHNISRRSVYNWFEDGKLPVVKVGRGINRIALRKDQAPLKQPRIKPTLQFQNASAETTPSTYRR
jgi:predicted site-specific integrase-resolvase